MDCIDEQSNGDGGRSGTSSNKTSQHKVQEDDAIPYIVQQALGMKYRRNHRIDGTSISGLEAFLLPDYLLNRLGFASQQQQQHQDGQPLEQQKRIIFHPNNNNPLPKELQRAQHEEVTHRLKHRNRRYQRGANIVRGGGSNVTRDLHSHRAKQKSGETNSARKRRRISKKNSNESRYCKITNGLEEGKDTNSNVDVDANQPEDGLHDASGVKHNDAPSSSIHKRVVTRNKRTTRKRNHSEKGARADNSNDEFEEECASGNSLASVEYQGRQDKIKKNSNPKRSGERHQHQHFEDGDYDAQQRPGSGHPTSGGKSVSNSMEDAKSSEGSGRGRKRKRRKSGHVQENTTNERSSEDGKVCKPDQRSSMIGGVGDESMHNNAKKMSYHQNENTAKQNAITINSTTDQSTSLLLNTTKFASNSSSALLSQSGNVISSKDWLNYQMMARVIIAPFTSSLIALLIENKQKGLATIVVDTSTSKTFAETPQAPRHPQSTLPITASTKSTPNNMYKRKPINSKSRITLSSPREPLESIVDGVVDTLVRRTHRIRPTLPNSYKSFKNGRDATKGRNDGINLIHRRRRQRKNQQHVRQNYNQKKQLKRSNPQSIIPATDDKFIPLDSSANPSLLPTRIKPNSTSINDWLLERNLLSTGYILGSSDTLTSQQQQNNQFLRGCPNMAPGVHCLQPNSLTSYARSSGLMKLIHAVVGDDVLREILLNAVVLIPVIPTTGDNGTPCTNSLSSQSELFGRGNYFQLCGPPLNMLAKQFEKMNASSTANQVNCREISFSSAGAKDQDEQHRSGAATSERQKRKRKLSSNEISPAETIKPNRNNAPLHEDSTASFNNSNARKSKNCSEEHWDPNKAIPRSKLFYCDFYTKHVGFSPRHLLNQSEKVNTLKPSNMANGNSFTPHLNPTASVEVRLLNAMVQLWPRSSLQRSVEYTKPNSVSSTVNTSNKRRKRWARLRKSGINICQETRRRHQSCDYARLLERSCPLLLEERRPCSLDEFKKTDSKTALAHLVQLYTPTEQVGLFLENVLRNSFPSCFWGSEYNFHQVVNTMKVFVNLGRTEQFPQKAVVEGIRVLDMAWLHSPSSQKRLPTKKMKSNTRLPCPQRLPKLSRSDHESATALLRNVMRWLYCQFIIPLLRSTFYVTETEFTGCRVMYYRKPVWGYIKSISMKILIKRQYREMEASKAQKLLSSHNIGCPPAPLRLLPKKTGIRAIAMLSKSFLAEGTTSCVYAPHGKDGVETKFTGRLALPTNRRTNTHLPPNKILQSTFHALKYEQEKKPKLFGCGVHGMTEVFPSFCLFAKALKRMRSRMTTVNGDPNNISENIPLYITSADIQHCYDTINQKKLNQLMPTILEEDYYVTKNHFILHSKNARTSLRCQWKKSTSPPDNFTNFLSVPESFTEKYSRSLFIDGVNCSIEKKGDILRLLRDHIFGQLIVANGSFGRPRYLLQKSGIPQGSVLSSFFCNVYFGNLEKFMLDDVFEKDSLVVRGSATDDVDCLFIQTPTALHLLLRIVDDFLLISTCKNTSNRFLNNINKGVPSLGVKINSAKTRVNYHASLKNDNSGEMEAVEVPSSHKNGLKDFPWCGLLIDTHTCEISLDIERFSGHLATDTVTIHRLGNEGLHLKKKMKDFVRPRCSQNLLFSSLINGLDTIFLNFYLTFLLCAIKTIYYVKNCSGSNAPNNCEFIYSSVCDTIEFAYLLICSKIKHGANKKSIGLVTSSHQNDRRFELAWKDAKFLGLHAFRSVTQKEGRHFADLCHLFSESRDSPTTNRDKLIQASKRALKLIPL